MTADAFDQRAAPKVHPTSAMLSLRSGEAIVWNPWSMPIMLDERSTMILDLLDGEVTLGELATELAGAFDADQQVVLADLMATAQSFARHGLLVDGGRLAARPLALLGHDPNP